MIHLMRERRFPAAFKCYHNFHKIGSVSSDNLFFKMVIHVHCDSAFRRYQKEMSDLSGFFVDINLFKENREKVAQTAKNTNDLLKNVNSSNETLANDDLADEDANLMIKLKFLTYKSLGLCTSFHVFYHCGERFIGPTMKLVTNWNSINTLYSGEHQHCRFWLY
ncbi:hypothetical protein ACSBR1_021564 [Camellia fascicularis]